MTKPDGKRVDVSRKDVFEVKMGDRESVLLSENEATQLFERLNTALRGKETPESPKSQTPSTAGGHDEAPPTRTSSARSNATGNRKFTPEIRRRQNMLMAGIIVFVIGVAFIFADVHTLTAPPPPAFKPPPAPYVHFTIDAGPNGSFTFNGTSPGPTLTVPVNTRVWVTFHVDSSAGYPHSWVLVPGNVSPVPTPDFTPVFPNATSPNPTAGTPVGGTDEIVFLANIAGSYKYICEFPGHFESGMWGWFNVTSGNTTASVPKEHFSLVAGANATQTFNGTTPGPALTAPNNSMVWLTLTIPSTSASNHSWILVPGNITNTTSPNYTPVFKNASSPNPTAGTPKNTTIQIYFNLTRVGNYKYISEVSNDFAKGMWGTFNVTKSNYTALVASAHPTVSSTKTIQSSHGTRSGTYYTVPDTPAASSTIFTRADYLTSLGGFIGIYADAAVRETI
ncbi:MAG: hypothetical protein KIY11_03135 [Thermoplasmata archaeon]|nr:hypothetical protein [Candidatus Sysuiplasma acidicola]